MVSCEDRVILWSSCDSFCFAPNSINSLLWRYHVILWSSGDSFFFASNSIDACQGLGRFLCICCMLSHGNHGVTLLLLLRHVKVEEVWRISPSFWFWACEFVHRYWRVMWYPINAVISMRDLISFWSSGGCVVWLWDYSPSCRCLWGFLRSYECVETWLGHNISQCSTLVMWVFEI